MTGDMVVKRFKDWFMREPLKNTFWMVCTIGFAIAVVMMITQLAFAETFKIDGATKEIIFKSDWWIKAETEGVVINGKKCKLTKRAKDDNNDEWCFVDYKTKKYVCKVKWAKKEKRKDN